MVCGCCQCFGGKPENDDMYEDAERDEKEEEEILESTPLNGDVVNEDIIEDEDSLPPPPDEVPPNIPEVIVTESSFEKPKKKKGIKKIFKKIKKPIAKVTFAKSTTEKTSLVETPVGSEDSGYGTTLTTLHRSDSMESFMSALSTATSVNVEEFGDEVPPSRLQIQIQYDQKRWMLSIGVKQGDCLITARKQTMFWQVHMTLLPFKKHRFKTRYKSTSTPIFNQSFEVENISVQALPQLAVRYRVYGRTGRAGRKKLAGATEVELGDIMKCPDQTIKDWRVLKRSTDRSSDAGSVHHDNLDQVDLQNTQENNLVDLEI